MSWAANHRSSPPLPAGVRHVCRAARQQPDGISCHCSMPVSGSAGRGSAAARIMRYLVAHALERIALADRRGWRRRLRGDVPAAPAAKRNAALLHCWTHKEGAARRGRRPTCGAACRRGGQRARSRVGAPVLGGQTSARAFLVELPPPGRACHELGGAADPARRHRARSRRSAVNAPISAGWHPPRGRDAECRLPERNTPCAPSSPA